jgi:hypothetical protein
VSSLRLFAGVLAIPIVLVCLAVACGYDEGDDLPEVVERATPAGATPVGGCGGSPGLIESPSHECTYLVRGEAGDVTRAVADALLQQGFDVSCRGGETTVEVAGLRGDVRVRAEITAAGSLTDDGDGVVNVFDEGYAPSRAKPIPRGSVALSLSASRQSEASADFQREWIAGGFSAPGFVVLLPCRWIDSGVAGRRRTSPPLQGMRLRLSTFAVWMKFVRCLGRMARNSDAPR